MDDNGGQVAAVVAVENNNNLVDNMEMERQASIMDLAQQQQMALQRLDEVVQNQRNLRDTIDDAQQGQAQEQQEQEMTQPGEEGEDEGNEGNDDGELHLEDGHLPQQEEGEGGDRQPPLLLHNPQVERRRHHYFLCSITQVYFALSAMLALLAVVTSPSNILFDSIRIVNVKAAISTSTMNVVGGSIIEQQKQQQQQQPTEMKEASQLQHAVDAFKAQIRNTEEGNVATDNAGGAGAAAAVVDGHGDIVDAGGHPQKGEWEAVADAAARSKTTKHHSPLLSEASKKKSGEQQQQSESPSSSLPPLLSSTWTDTWMDFVGGVKEHVHMQYLILSHQFHSPLSMPQFPTPETVASSSHSSTGVPGIESPPSVSSSSRWTFGLEWMNRKETDKTSEGGGKHKYDAVKKKEQSKKNYRRIIDVSDVKLHSLLSPMLRMIDPSLITPFLSNTNEGDGTPTETTTTSHADSQDNNNNNPSGGTTAPATASHPTTPTTTTQRTKIRTVIDKIFASTPRLIAIANLLLAVTYLLHTAVADVFLGPVNISTAGIHPPNNNPGPLSINNALEEHATRRRRAGRERFGGFLLFKLLLMSAVLEPDSVDLFILLMWYTLLSFLRSLSHLAGTTANHASQSGESPSPGALRLLMLVLACDTIAAIGCVALFYSTGLWNMLLLLTSDCVLLALDATVHIVRYGLAKLEDLHRIELVMIEDRRVEYSALRRRRRGEREEVATTGDNAPDVQNEDEGVEERTHVEEVDDSHYDGIDDLTLERELLHLEEAPELTDAAHASSMTTMDSVVFSLELYALIVKITHFLHIWALHGTSFGIVDGVLALHLHSTVSMICKKISERRNAHRISQELDDHFPDANDLDIRKAAAAGDVCCICLNPMTVGGSIKKVGCGHMFHANCLREVVERERSIESAKCPLCRASLVTGRHDTHAVRPGVVVGLGNNGNNETTNNANNNDGAGGTGGDERQAPLAQPAANPQLNRGEQSLLRFSTENILPTWLPVPAFAFEVVRRETTAVVEPTPNPEGGWQRFFRRGGEVQVAGANNNGGNDQAAAAQPQEQQQQQQQPPMSFWRRLGILVGAIPMSPEEEATALNQLVDMFPQYDRADLLRELRSRRSAEAVAESILLGIFSGIPRGGGGVDVD